ncbi:hypothetical protein VP01_1356g3 [Puccinia sorghi]|uniref:Uncharacterized protein n=1 Tax=Puccinia sorghi TaxID=27349 RepID=A0A0L6VLZ8_9BASI|nr:hypothetical protein VP01_1356g3 [Puccinia sorghi]
MYKGAEAEYNPPVGKTPGKSQRGLQDHNICSSTTHPWEYSRRLHHRTAPLNYGLILCIPESLSSASHEHLRVSPEYIQTPKSSGFFTQSSQVTQKYPSHPEVSKSPRSIFSLRSLFSSISWTQHKANKRPFYTVLKFFLAENSSQKRFISPLALLNLQLSGPPLLDCPPIMPAVFISFLSIGLTSTSLEVQLSYCPILLDPLMRLFQPINCPHLLHQYSLSLTSTMFQPSSYPNSTLWTVTVHQSLVESLLEKFWSNDRSFLGVSACHFQVAEQVLFAVNTYQTPFQSTLSTIIAQLISLKPLALLVLDIDPPHHCAQIQILFNLKLVACSKKHLMPNDGIVLYR